MIEKIKKFIDCRVPAETCNLRCHYCYITLQRRFNQKLPKFRYSPSHIAKALNKNRLGGVCCINLCGDGETLLPPEIPELIKLLLTEGHYVMVVTNGTITRRFQQIAEFDKELLKRLFFKFSFQFLELKRTNQMDVFFDNIRLMRDSGCSFTLEITPNDELIPYIDEVKDYAIKNVGAIPHVSVARDSRTDELKILTNLSKDKYESVWNTFDSDMFKFKLSVFNKKRKEFCYAGFWSYYLNLLTGELRQCYKGENLQNIFENIETPIVEKPIGCHCLQPHCYNAHAWLTFGDIPYFDAPTYLDMRNRVTKTGEEWVREPMKSFFNQKLKDNNKEYSNLQKFAFELKRLFKQIFSVQKMSGKVKITVLGIKINFKDQL